MARVSVGTFPPGSQFGMGLDRYAEVLGLDMCGYNGVNRPTTHRDNACVAIVNQSQRDLLAEFLLQAEQRREEELGYFLAHKWVYNEEHDIGYGSEYLLNRKHLVSVGTPVSEDIQLAAPVSYGTPPFDANNEPTDPVVVIVTTSVSTDEIVIAYPGEDVAINPKSIVDNGDGTVSIRINRCRLVKPEYNDDRDDPISYYSGEAFLETVDVKRQYVDVSNGAFYVWMADDCATNCEPACESACPMIIGPSAYELSVVHLKPATYVNGAWTTRSCTAHSGVPDVVRFTYLSGRYPMSDEIGTIRLAHTLMPRPPCSCDLVKDKWEEDNERSKHFSKYGSKIGAIEVWMADQSNKIGHGGALGTTLRHYGG